MNVCFFKYVFPSLYCISNKSRKTKMVTKVVNMSQILHKINRFKRRSHLGCNTNMVALKDTKAVMYYGQ